MADGGPYGDLGGVRRDDLAEIAADCDEAARLQRDGDPAAAAFHERAARLAARQAHRPAQQFAETGLAVARTTGDERAEART